MGLTTLLLQVDSTADSAIIQSTGGDSFVSYLEFMMKGGVMIIPIFILLFLCFYIIIERLLTITKMAKHDPKLIDELVRELKAGKLEEAIRICERSPNSQSNILKSAVSVIGAPIHEIELVMERAMNIEIARMEKGLGYLGLIASIAPILGFIGTILGVINIFYSISITEDISIGSISGGLYEKMISSGAGLVVAVVAYSGYHLFNIKIDNFSLKAQQQALSFIHTILKPGQ